MSAAENKLILIHGLLMYLKGHDDATSDVSEETLARVFYILVEDILDGEIMNFNQLKSNISEKISIISATISIEPKN